ncbi:hypothetical protein EKO27_g1673 [Xylaria grammica]|uniref:Stc1 domain-containing protein n=1 Tax=Xylaria grammica TaxID=363999 RepID=A0A439DGC3_9PEZI|nr:hypothetical protein EKO27_g1673 [Xylaria grammica]
MPAVVRRANKLPRSTGSTSSQPLLQEADRDTLFLPMNDHIYLTQTKDRKPALGRKKTGKLLEDFGFDILGQSLGVPSRKDYEREARPLSVVSQSSGLVTAPDTPRPSRAHTHEDAESPVVYRKANSRHSSSTALPIEIARYKDPDHSGSHPQNPSPLRPQAFNQHYIPPPPPPPPSIVGWRKHSMSNIGVAPIPMSYYDAAYQPTNLSSYSYNGPAGSHGVANWGNSQCHVPSQYLNHLGISMPQTTAIPMLPLYRQPSQPQPTEIPHAQTIPTFRSASIPPPPPPPLPQQDWPQPLAMETGQAKASRQYPKQASNTKKAMGRAHQTENLIRDARQTYENVKNSEAVKQRLSKRIHHVHVCAGCGKKRSTRFQKAHPLKRGEIPALNYCYNCLKDAADTDCHTSDEDAGGGSPIRKGCTKRDKHDPSLTEAKKTRQNRKEASVPWPSSDEGHTIANGNYTYEQSRRGPRWVKKSNRFGSFSRLFARKVTSHSRPKSASRSIDKAPKSPIRLGDGGAGGRARAIREAEALALPRAKYSNVESRSTKHGSPLVPQVKEPDKVKNDAKVRTISANRLPSARTRVPRPRSQLESARVECPPSTSTNDSAHVIGSPPCLDAGDDDRVAPMLRPATMETFSNTSNRNTPNAARRTAGRENTCDDAHERVKTGRPYSSAAADRTNVPRDGSGLGLRAPVSESLRIPVDAGAEVALKEAADKPTGYIDTSFHSDEFRMPSNHGPQINPGQTETRHQVPSSDNSGRSPPSGNAPEVVGNPKVPFNWGEPLTPTDVPYVADPNPSCVVSDSWSDYQADIEREVEEMAERDLAFAVSYNSDSDHSHSGTATLSITEADAEKDVEDYTPTKKIEFSDEEEQQQKFANSKSHIEPFVAHPKHSSNLIAGLLDRQQDNMYNESHSGQNVDDDVDYPSPVGSSLIGHTGHSAENLVQNTPTRLADGRRFMRLSSA